MKNNRYLITLLTFVFMSCGGFGQDTSKLQAGNHLKSNSDTLNATMSPSAGAVNSNHNSISPHSTVNPNSGTIVPNTTSGTLNSTVNPNTQLVIPIHKGKKKSNSSEVPGAGTGTPK